MGETQIWGETHITATAAQAQGRSQAIWRVGSLRIQNVDLSMQQHCKQTAIVDLFVHSIGTFYLFIHSS